MSGVGVVDNIDYVNLRYQECIGYTVDGGAMLFTANATVYEERAVLALATA
jgi:hypothetical protein